MIQRCALCGRTGLDVESRIVSTREKPFYRREPRCIDREACAERAAKRETT